MKKIYKISVIAVLSVVCLVGRPVRTQAQVITTDPLNLAEAILDIFQNADMNGWLEGISTLESSREQYENFMQKMEDFKMILQFIGDGQKLVSEVYHTTKLVQETLEFMDDFDSFFSSATLSNSYVYLNNLQNIRSGFVSVFEEMQNDFTNTLNQVKGMKRGESGDILQIAGDFAERFHTRVTTLANIARNRTCDTYSVYAAEDEAQRTKVYLKAMIY